MENRKTVAIVGAASRQGRWLIATYRTDYHIVALSTEPRMADADQAVEWRAVEEYSITSTTEALRGVDYALYPTQKSTPSTRLNQGSVQDANLLLADTFARAAEANQLQHIVFLGEALPKGSYRQGCQEEIVSVLASRQVPLTPIYVERTTRLPERLPRWLSRLTDTIDRGPRSARQVPKVPAGVLGNARWYRQHLTVGSYPLGAAEKALLPPVPDPAPYTDRQEENTVRSYQRLANPQRKPAGWVAREYFSWLPRFFRYVLRARQGPPNQVTFLLLGVNILQMRLVEDRSTPERHLFYITGGWLVKRTDYGWLEFRNVLGGRYVISAIHEFVPRLPWAIYVTTQARVHLWVMNSFGKHLARQSGKG